MGDSTTCVCSRARFLSFSLSLSLPLSFTTPTHPPTHQPAHPPTHPPTQPTQPTPTHTRTQGSKGIPGHGLRLRARQKLQKVWVHDRAPQPPQPRQHRMLPYRTSHLRLLALIACSARCRRIATVRGVAKEGVARTGRGCGAVSGGVRGGGGEWC
jgi:hypothetical protein